jgi:Protein of unknown function (DUF1592)/Protein of unknown function (DUF1588)/Protein of unknown function (DUF1595)/Protein of unknown function (DUF1587)/Protein of unknown function (DUF1585)
MVRRREVSRYAILGISLFCVLSTAACRSGASGQRGAGTDAAGGVSGQSDGAANGADVLGAGDADIGYGGPDGPVALLFFPGWTGARRLADTEYTRSIQDLLGLAGHDGELMDSFTGVPDRTIDRFDNLAEGMSVGPGRFQVYFANAVRMTGLAFADAGARAALVACTPAPGGESACAAQVMRAFARRAWRRPPTDAEVADLVTLVRGGLTAGDAFDTALQRAFAALLVSDSFLYRVEFPPTPDATSPNRISAHELATRLSYLLWSTTPDDMLLSLADSGALLTPDVLAAQVTRLLADARADGFVRNFLGQWLGFRALQGDTLERQAEGFLEWSDAAQQSVAEEARLFAARWLAGNQPFPSFLTDDVNFIDFRLGVLYDVFTSYSSDTAPVGFEQRVIPGDRRKGYLGLMALLAAEATPAESSPTRRGRWVAERLLCLDVAEAPPPAMHETDLPGTPRERAAAIGARAACAGCHAMVDGIGLGFERFDNTGRTRFAYLGDAPPAEPSGTYPGGEAFVGLEALADRLVADPRVRTCAIRNATEYALGRRLDGDDLGRLAGIDARAGAGASLRGLLGALIADEAFQQRRPEGM